MRPSLLALALLLLAAPAAGQTPITVAVLDLDATHALLEPRELDLLRDVAYVTASRVLTANYQLVPREVVRHRLAPHAVTLATCEADCVIEAGRLARTDLVVAHEVIRSGETFKATVRLHFVDPPRLMSVETANVPTIELLQSVVGGLTQKALGPLIDDDVEIYAPAAPGLLAPAAPPPAPSEPRFGPWYDDPAGWSLLGLGVVAVGASIGMHQAFVTHRDNAGNPNYGTLADRERERDAAYSLEAPVTAVWLIGAHLMTAGVVLLTIPDRADPPPVTATPWLTGSGAGLSALITF